MLPMSFNVASISASEQSHERRTDEISMSKSNARYANSRMQKRPPTGHAELKRRAPSCFKFKESKERSDGGQRA